MKSNERMTPDTPGEPVWERIGKAGTVSERIALQVLRMVEANELRPGARLPSERELAALIGVSRPSLREAMKTLEARGHVSIRHGVGIFAADPRKGGIGAALSQQEASLEELFSMREILEGSAAGWAAEMRNRSRLREAAAVLRELERASRVKPLDYVQLQRLDIEFHMRIVEAAGNRFLTQAMQVLQTMIAEAMDATLRIPGSLERSRSDHRQIMEAIKAGDCRSARNAAKRHVLAARRAALGQIESKRRKSTA